PARCRPAWPSRLRGPSPQRPGARRARARAGRRRRRGRRGPGRSDRGRPPALALAPLGRAPVRLAAVLRHRGRHQPALVAPPLVRAPLAAAPVAVHVLSTPSVVPLIVTRAEAFGEAAFGFSALQLVAGTEIDEAGVRRQPRVDLLDAAEHLLGDPAVVGVTLGRRPQLTEV